MVSHCCSAWLEGKCIFFIFIAVEVSIISFWFSLQLYNFKRHLAQLIGDLDDSIAAEEDAIVSKVKNVVRDYRDVKSVSTLVTGGGGHAVIEAFNTRPNSEQCDATKKCHELHADSVLSLLRLFGSKH